MAMHRVSYSFQPVARAQLFVGMMKVIAKRLQGDLQSLRNFRGISAFGKQAQYALLLFGERGDGSGSCRSVSA